MLTKPLKSIENKERVHKRNICDMKYSINLHTEYQKPLPHFHAHHRFMAPPMKNGLST